jgi:hypothetical protein
MTGTDIDLRVAGRNSPVVTRAKDRLAMEIAVERSWRDAVEVLSKGDRTASKRWRRRFLRWAQEEDFQRMLTGYMKAVELLETPETLRALYRRAVKGNIPAIKLALESSGYHNPRVQHEHSGEVSITIKNAPRPVRTADHTEADAPVIDADVVE